MKEMFVLIAFVAIIAACTSEIDYQGRKVLLTVENEELIIHNETLCKIHYYALDARLAAVIDWYPSMRGPTIESGESIPLSFNEIPSIYDEQVTSGDRIIVYWWDPYFPKHKKLNVEEIIL